MTKAPTPTENSKKQCDNTKTPPKTSITQGLRTDLGQSVGVTTPTQLVLLNRFTGYRPFHLPQKLNVLTIQPPSSKSMSQRTGRIVDVLTTCACIRFSVRIYIPLNVMCKPAVLAASASL